MSIKINGATTNQDVEVDVTSKAMRVTLYDINGIPNGPRYTYDAATAAFTPGSTPQDVFTITGSGSKIIRVTRVRLSGIQTTAGINSWFLLRRSTANSGGTSASVTAVQRDTNAPGATATVLQYTANPTAGNLVGNIRSGKLLSNAATGTSNDTLIWDFDDYQSTPIYLRGTSQVLAVNFGGAALPPGLSIHVSITWTEE